MDSLRWRWLCGDSFAMSKLIQMDSTPTTVRLHQFDVPILKDDMGSLAQASPHSTFHIPRFTLHVIPLRLALHPFSQCRRDCRFHSLTIVAPRVTRGAGYQVDGEHMKRILLVFKRCSDMEGCCCH